MTIRYVLTRGLAAALIGLSSPIWLPGAWIRVLGS